MVGDASGAICRDCDEKRERERAEVLGDGVMGCLGAWVIGCLGVWVYYMTSQSNARTLSSSAFERADLQLPVHIKSI